MDPNQIDIQVEKSKDKLVKTIYTTLYYKLNLENHESINVNPPFPVKNFR
jgi:hypothetical protein